MMNNFYYTVVRKLNLIRAFVFFLLVLFYSGCANQLPPGGGAVDKVPPEITELYPPSGTVNYKDNYFELSFSEFVDKRSVKDAIFISPSPGGELDLNWSWNAKSVKVTFPKELKQNTTYAVTIGTDLVDINAHNRMGSAYSFAFSTGPVIDKGEITGRVYADKPNGVMLFAYKLSDTAAIDPGVLKPDYISQAGDSGYFKLKGLGPGSYRVFAIEDQYRDLLFQPEQDKYGAPPMDIILSEKDTLFPNLNFILTKYDTIKPRILSAVMTDKHHILANFSKELDSSAINVVNFYVIDSTSGKKYNPVYAFKGNTKNTEMVISINNDLVYENSNFVVVNGIKDINKNKTEFDYIKLTTSSRNDTTKTSIIRMDPASGETVDFIKPAFRFFCDDAFDSTIIKKGITCADTAGKPFRYSIRFPDNASFIIYAEEELAPKQDYRIRFDYNKFKNLAGVTLDSVFVYRFKTINGLDFTGATGTIKNLDSSKNPIIILQGTDKKKFSYVQKPAEGNKFNFDRVEPGQYILRCFYDTDKNGIYSYGSVFPYVPSEVFRYFGKVLDLKPRWTVTDINLDFENPQK